MKSTYLKLVFVSALSILALNAQASDNKKKCTDAAIAASNAYDPESTSALNCIGVRDEFKVVVSWNNNLKNGKIFKTKGATVGQQAVNVRNLTRDYKNNYGMIHGKEYKIGRAHV